MQCQKRKFGNDSFDPYRESDFFSDAVLRTEDGNKFKINRNLLARHCPFFKALFSGDFGDSIDVLLKGIDAETLGSILVYLYTGTIHLNEEKATKILVASDYLLIDSLVQESRSFVLREMSPTNCVPVFLAAWRIESLGILNNCYRFIVIHFEEVVSQSEEIGSLPLEALKTFLRDKSLNVSDERTVWNVIVRWLKFDFPDRLQLFPELLRYISLEDADEPLVNDIIHPNMIQKNNFFLEPVFGELQYADHLQNFRQILNSQSIMTGSRIPTEVHLIIHYCIAHNSFDKNIYLTWDGETDYWRKVGSVNFFPDYLIQLGRYVYMFDTSMKMSSAFDTFDGKCVPLTPINKNRCFYSVVSVNGFIYVMGGIVDDFNYREDIERFDLRTGKWELVSRMAPMSLSEAVAVNGYIYAIGYDRVVRNPNMMVQVYDPTSDKWSFVSAPRLFMPEITAVAFRGHLYLIGGETFGCVLRSMEEYDPVTDVWIPMPDLPVAYRSPRAVALKDVLIVYEEDLVYKTCGESCDGPPPVYWDSENRMWHIIEESSPLRMIHFFKFCTITEPNVVKDIVKRNRQRSKRYVKSPLA
ncbi:Kelch-like protein 3 [Araneus ventricosus]|uniref:Kelch-like protein diablo n=1 Tax=Araneus ventricosus TaxID=182803 RepID=A0A4Y2L5E3_ARAVE|nr:Kelch-like protein 3 [Araneus ventricosus]